MELSTWNYFVCLYRTFLSNIVFIQETEGKKPCSCRVFLTSSELLRLNVTLKKIQSYIRNTYSAKGSGKVKQSTSWNTFEAASKNSLGNSFSFLWNIWNGLFLNTVFPLISAGSKINTAPSTLRSDEGAALYYVPHLKMRHLLEIWP